MNKNHLLILAVAIGMQWLLTGGAPGQNRELTAEGTGHRYVFYTPGREPAVATRDLTNLRLTQSACADRTTIMDYSLQIGIRTDADIQKAVHGGPRWSGQTERGVTTYIPRVTLTARNKPVEIGMTMVIEYFSQDVADKNDISCECVEHIPLVFTEKGQSTVFEGAGVPLFKEEHQASNLAGRTGTSQHGKEFYGLIASLFNGKTLLFQQYAPAALSKSCSPDLPPAQPPRARQMDGQQQPARRPWRTGQ